MAPGEYKKGGKKHLDNVQFCGGGGVILPYIAPGPTGCTSGCPLCIHYLLRVRNPTENVGTAFKAKVHK